MEKKGGARVAVAASRCANLHNEATRWGRRTVQCCYLCAPPLYRDGLKGGLLLLAPSLYYLPKITLTSANSALVHRAVSTSQKHITRGNRPIETNRLHLPNRRDVEYYHINYPLYTRAGFPNHLIGG